MLPPKSGNRSNTKRRTPSNGITMLVQAAMVSQCATDRVKPGKEIDPDTQYALQLVSAYFKDF